MALYGGRGGPGGMGWQGWENAGGQSVGPGGAWDENTSYNQNYRGKIPEGARTFNPNAPPPTRGPNGELLHQNPNWTQGGNEYYWLNQDGNPAGSTGFNGSNVSNAPWNNQPPAPRQGGGRMQPQNQAQSWGGGGQTDPFQGGGPQFMPAQGGGGWGGQTDPMQGGQGPRLSNQAGGWGGQMDPYQGGPGRPRPTMAANMLGSMYGQRR
jgi:hypothetical protein